MPGALPVSLIWRVAGARPLMRHGRPRGIGQRTRKRPRVSVNPVDEVVEYGTSNFTLEETFIAEHRQQQMVDESAP